MIHLIRDPRPVALSRNGHPTFHSKFTDYRKRGRRTGNGLVREAALYCDSALQDIHKRKQLSMRFPGQVKEVIFEEFVQKPASATRDIYNFIGVEPHEDVMSWLHNNTNQSQHIATKWKTSENPTTWKAVYSHPLCRQLFKEYSHVWPALSIQNAQ